MAGYSLVTLLVKLATRTGEIDGFGILAIATGIVATSAIAIALFGGAYAGKEAGDFLRPWALYAVATGIALAIAVASLFKALSMGPASVVVPIYGMFILGGAVLAVLFLDEPVTAKRAIGMLLCIAGIVLVAT